MSYARPCPTHQYPPQASGGPLRRRPKRPFLRRFPEHKSMSVRTSAGGRLKILVVISPQLVYQAPGTIYTHVVAMQVRIRWGGAPREGSKIGTAPQPQRQVLTTIPPKNGILGAPRHDSCERGLAGGMYQARDAIYCSFWPISSGLVPGRGWVPSRPNWRLAEPLRSLPSLEPSRVAVRGIQNAEQT